MSDLAHQFETAAEAVQKLPKKPDNADLLKLYALFKQGSTGDVTGDRPGMMDFVGRAKYDAWSGIEGMDQEEAKQAYIDLVDSLTPE
jgi:diazepam-binding inhibitor (GABA receptor modulating acyl-CoA-binding protein)